MTLLEKLLRESAEMEAEQKAVAAKVAELFMAMACVEQDMQRTLTNSFRIPGEGTLYCIKHTDAPGAPYELHRLHASEHGWFRVSDPTMILPVLTALVSKAPEAGAKPSPHGLMVAEYNNPLPEPWAGRARWQMRWALAIAIGMAVTGESLPVLGAWIVAGLATGFGLGMFYASWSIRQRHANRGEIRFGGVE